MLQQFVIAIAAIIGATKRMIDPIAFLLTIFADVACAIIQNNTPTNGYNYYYI